MTADLAASANNAGDAAGDTFDSIERRRTRAGKTGCEVSYFITGLPRARTAPDDLLALVRGHWGIGNRLHWRRDVALREDASRVRTGAAPQALATLRNTLLRIVRPQPGLLAATRETLAENRLKAIAAAQYGILRIALGRSFGAIALGGAAC